MTKRTSNFCTQGHQPLDYDDFRAHCSNVSEWPWGPGWMHLGECNACGSSISYPPPAELARPEDYQGPGRGPRLEAPLPNPSIFWDESRQVYGYRDGDEEGVCQHASTTDVLDLLGAGEAPTLEQLHGLGDDWGFRSIDFTDRRGRSHRLLAESYRMAEHYEPYDGLNAESRGELARITEFSRSNVVGTGA